MILEREYLSMRRNNKDKLERLAYCEERSLANSNDRNSYITAETIQEQQ
jgi:hypothetical protein